MIHASAVQITASLIVLPSWNAEDHMTIIHLCFPTAVSSYPYHEGENGVFRGQIHPRRRRFVFLNSIHTMTFEL